MTILDTLNGPRPDAVLYLRQEGAMTAAEFGSVIAPLLTLWKTIGQEVRSTTVEWTLTPIVAERDAADATGETGGSQYEWQVTSSGPLRGLPSMLQGLVINEGQNADELYIAYKRRPPEPVITSFKVLLVKRDPNASVPALIAESRRIINVNLNLPGGYMKIAANGDPLSGDRGEVPTPTARGAVPRWGIAAGVLALAGVVGVAVNEGRKKRRKR